MYYIWSLDYRVAFGYMSGGHVPIICYLINLLGHHHTKRWPNDRPGTVVICALEQCSKEMQFSNILLIQTLIKFNDKGLNNNIWSYGIRLQNILFNNGRSYTNKVVFCFTQKKLKLIKYEKRQ